MSKTGATFGAYNLFDLWQWQVVGGAGSAVVPDLVPEGDVLVTSSGNRLRTSQGTLIKIVYTPPVHPVVADWQARATANGGIYASNEVSALDTLVKAWEAQGLIESGLTSGVTTQNSIIQYCLPGCGTNQAASAIPLLYPAGTPSPADVNGNDINGDPLQNYSGTTKSWNDAISDSIQTGWNAASYSTNINEGFFSVRTNTQDSGRVYSNRNAPYQMALLPNYGGNIYSQIYGTGMGASPVVAETAHRVLHVNAVGGLTYFYNGLSLIDQDVSSGQVQNEEFILSRGDVFNYNPQRFSFFAASVRGLPIAKTAAYINAIEAFKTAIGGI